MIQVTEANKGIVDKIPPTVLEDLKMKLASLEKSLLDKDPLMPNHLRESHRLLITYPETVHLLDDEGVAKLIQAAEEYTKTRIISEAAKGKGGGKKSKVDVNDL